MSEKYILWIEDEQYFEIARIRKLEKELKKTPYKLKIFEKPKEIYEFIKNNKEKILGIIVDLMLPASEEDFRILGGKFEGFEVGTRLAKVICKNFDQSIPIVVLTNLSKSTETGQKIWYQLDEEGTSCVKAKLVKSETSMKEFIDTIKKIFNIQ